jgi:hypothetical protein
VSRIRALRAVLRQEAFREAILQVPASSLYRVAASRKGGFEIQPTPHCFHPSPRNALPGFAPVTAPSFTTGTPFTNTSLIPTDS